MTTKTATIGNLISSKPGVLGGRPCLEGSRISVHALVARLRDGKRPEDLLDDWPHLDLARIYAGLAYYYANKERIEADWAADEALYDRLAAKYPNGWTRENDQGM